MEAESFLAAPMFNIGGNLCRGFKKEKMENLEIISAGATQ